MASWKKLTGAVDLSAKSFLKNKKFSRQGRMGDEYDDEIVTVLCDDGKRDVPPGRWDLSNKE